MTQTVAVVPMSPASTVTHTYSGGVLIATPSAHRFETSGLFRDIVFN
jgi:hypothetical protein